MDNDETNFTEFVVRDCGVLYDETGFRLGQGNNPRVLQRHLTEKLSKRSESSLQLLIQNIQFRLTDSLKLKEFLVPLKIANGVDGTMSMMQVLLGIDSLQSELIDTLLEKLPEYVDQDDISFRSPWRLIIQQLCWLDRVIDSSRLTTKIIEVISISSFHIQQDLIAHIPEIVMDSQQKEIIGELQNLLETESNLTVPILECLSQINLPPDSKEALTVTVTSKLESADLNSLPAIIRFLLQSATADDAARLATQLRKEIDFRSISEIIELQAQHLARMASAAETRKGKEKAYAVPESNGNRIHTQDTFVFAEDFITEALKSGMLFQKFMADSFLKVIKETDDPTAKIFDFIILIIIGSIDGPHMRRVEIIMKRKILSGFFNANLVKTILLNHRNGLKPFATTIFSLADIFLRIDDVSITTFVEQIYLSGFQVFDAYSRQEIIGQLVTAVGSGNRSEIDTALNILLLLAKEYADAVSVYAIFIKNILDYIENLNGDQIRTYFAVMSTLCIRNIQRSSPNAISENSLLSELQMLIRKQLSNVSEYYKSIGVIGALSLVNELGSSNAIELTNDGNDSDQEMTMQSSQIGPDEPLRAPIEIIRMVQVHCRNSMRCLAIAYDELANMISNSNLHPRLIRWIKENVADDFSQIFLLGIDEYKGGINNKNSSSTVGTASQAENENDSNLIEMMPASIYDMKQEIWMKIDNESEILVNIYPFMTSHPLESLPIPNANNPLIRRQIILLMAPLFKLMQACEKALNKGSLQEIDAMIGAGLIMFEKDYLSISTSMSKLLRDQACSTLFYAINWCRELINAFSSQINFVEDRSNEDKEWKDEIGQKCLERIQGILCMEATLDKLIDKTGGFIPHGWEHIMKNRVNNKMSASHGRSKENMLSSEYVELTGQNESLKSSASNIGNRKRKITDLLGREGPKAKSNNFIGFTRLAQVRTYCRQIEVDTFNLLAWILHWKPSLKNTNEKEGSRTKMENFQHYDVLKFLLENLNEELLQWGSTVINRKSIEKESFLTDHGIFSSLRHRSIINCKNDIMRLFPSLCIHLENIKSEVIANLGEESDNASVIISDNEQNLKRVSCFEILLQCLEHTFTMITKANGRLLENINSDAFLELICARTKKDSSQPPHKIAVGYFSSFISGIPTLNAAASLIRIMELVLKLGKTPSDADVIIGRTCKQILEIDWVDRKTVKPDIISYILTQNISRSENKLAIITNYIENVFSALENQDTEALAAFPLLTKETFAHHVKVLFTELTGMLSSFSAKTRRTSEDVNIQLVYIANVIRCFKALIEYSKSFVDKAILSVFLKRSRAFIDNFCKKVLPFYDKYFMRHRESIVATLKIFQQGTRLLQNICSHCKDLKDNALTASVPALKKSLELFLFSVKTMLVNNGAQHAFWMGNLKHKSIRGQEISSQMPVTSSDDSVATDEEESSEKSGEELEMVNDVFARYWLEKTREPSPLSEIEDDTDPEETANTIFEGKKSIDNQPIQQKAVSSAEENLSKSEENQVISKAPFVAKRKRLKSLTQPLKEISESVHKRNGMNPPSSSSVRRLTQLSVPSMNRLDVQTRQRRLGLSARVPKPSMKNRFLELEAIGGQEEEEEESEEPDDADEEDEVEEEEDDDD